VAYQPYTTTYPTAINNGSTYVTTVTGGGLQAVQAQAFADKIQVLHIAARVNQNGVAITGGLYGGLYGRLRLATVWGYGNYRAKKRQCQN
jgi:hypothetical protein